VLKILLLFSSLGLTAPATTPTVDTLVIEKQAIQRLIKYPATLVPIVQGKLTSEITGTVTRIVRGLGTKVRRGEVIFYLKNNQMEMNFNNYAVRAPVSGIVAKLDVHLGKIVAVGESAGEVIDPNLYKFLVEAPATDVNRLKLGYEALFESETQNIKTKVSALSTVVNPRTGTIQMELLPIQKVENPTMGAVGRLTVYLPTEQQIIIPPEALVKLNLKKFVRKLDNQDTVRLTEVELGDLINGKHVVIKGLNPRDEIVLKSSEFVKDGDKVARQAKPASTPETITK
jgi:multidrug efflux pump subunit AcrA (membrane-fusion protein)